MKKTYPISYVLLIVFNLILTAISLTFITYYLDFQFNREIKFSGGARGLTFDKVSSAIRDILREEHLNVILDSVTTGSQYNLQSLIKGHSDLALIHANARIAGEDAKGITTITNLFQSPLQIISNNPLITSIDSIKNTTKVILGARYSGTAYTSDLVLKFFGIEVDQQFGLVDSFDEGMNSLVNGDAEVMCFLSGIPATLIRDMRKVYPNVSDIHFVEIPHHEALVANYPDLQVATIPTATYGQLDDHPFPKKDIKTIKVNTVLAASNRFSSEDSKIDKILQILSENRSHLVNEHPSMTFLNEEGSFVLQTLQRFPMNQAAKRYYAGHKPIFAILTTWVGFVTSLLTLLVSLVGLRAGYFKWKFEKFEAFVLSEAKVLIERMQKTDISKDDIQNTGDNLRKLKDDVVSKALQLGVNISKTTASREYIGEGIRRSNFLLYNLNRGSGQ